MWLFFHVLHWHVRTRKNTHRTDIVLTVFLYFLGLSFRSTAKAIEPFVDRTHVAIWYWVQEFCPKRVYPCKRVAAYLIDKTRVQIGTSEAWVWVATEPAHRTILGVYISRHRETLQSQKHFPGRWSRNTVSILSIQTEGLMVSRRMPYVGVAAPAASNSLEELDRKGNGAFQGQDRSIR